MWKVLSGVRWLVVQNVSQSLRHCHSTINRRKTVPRQLTNILRNQLYFSSPSLRENFFRPPGYYEKMVKRKNITLFKPVQIEEFEKVRSNQEKTKYLKTQKPDDVLKMIDFYHSQTRMRWRHFLPLFEDYCIHQADNWDPKTLLNFGDLFYVVDYKPINFLVKLLNTSVSRWTSLKFTKEQLLHLLFHITYFGESSEQLMVKLENELMSHVDTYTIDQLVILCNGFFQSNRRIKDPKLLDKIADIVIRNKDKLTPISLTAFLKTFRHGGYRKVSFYDELSNHVVKTRRILTDSRKLGSVVEIVRCYGSLRIYHKPLLQLITDVSCQMIADDAKIGGQNVRSKDVCQLMWGLSLFDIDIGNDKIEFLTDNIRSRLQAGEFTSYPEGLVIAATSLVTLGHFPTDIINECLSSRFLKNLSAISYMEKDFQLFLLYSSILIECRDYRGYDLPKGFIKKIPRHRFGFLEVEMARRPALRKLYENLKMRTEYVNCHFTLPHFQTACIELHLDALNRPYPIYSENMNDDIPQQVENLKQSVMKAIPCRKSRVSLSNDLVSSLIGSSTSYSNGGNEQVKRRIVIDILGWNQLSFNQNEIRLGTSKMKERQLKALGYEVITITPDDAKKIDQMTTEEVQEYIDKNIKHSLQVEI